MQKFIKYAIFIIGSLIVLVVFLTLLLPSQGYVKSNVNINAPKEVVLDQLKGLEGYVDWFPWIQPDSAINIIYYGEHKDHLDGFAFQFKGQEATGRYELTGMEDDSVLHFEFFFKDNPPITGVYELHASPNNKNTVVVWKMKMKAGWKPWWRFFAAMMGKLTDPLLKKGLVGLKRECEGAALGGSERATERL